MLLFFFVGGVQVLLNTNWGEGGLIKRYDALQGWKGGSKYALRNSVFFFF